VHCTSAPAAQSVSIHAFREEGDRVPQGPIGGSRMFQSTPSGRKATIIDRVISRMPRVSIHAFREEGDARAMRGPTMAVSFNPRLPGGRRPSRPGATVYLARFQSTPSGRKATPGLGTRRGAYRFQSTPSGRKATIAPRACSSAPLFQSTPSGRKATSSIPRKLPCTSFQSTPSGRKATASRTSCRVMIGFQSTPSGRKATKVGWCSHGVNARFNPRLPGGRRPVATTYRLVFHVFQSTPSGRKATSRFP